MLPAIGAIARLTYSWQAQGATISRMIKKILLALAALLVILLAVVWLVGSALLFDNPEPRAPWVEDPVQGVSTPAHWALGERRFAGLFTPLAEDDPAPLPLAEYLALPQPQRGKKTPFVERSDDDGEPQRLRVDERLVRVSGERLAGWRMLQELAGLVTPFTERVRQEADAAVAAERQAELAAQAEEYEARIRGLRTQLQEETRREIRDRLVQMAGYGASAGGSGQTAGKDA
jgi:pyruvate-ferredoxin/flavodoxin oxidoreductase